MFNPNRLQFAIDRRAVSKAELAEKLNITPRTLTNYLKGNTENAIEIIDKALKENCKDIFGLNVKGLILFKNFINRALAHDPSTS